MSRLFFAGSSEFAASILKKVLEEHFFIQAIITQPDKPKGRGKFIQKTPVKLVAEQFDIPVYQPNSLEEFQSSICSQHCDLLIVIAYGFILTKEILNWPTFGCVNVHASLVPQWRGASPIEHSILFGDTTSGVSLLKMDIGLDTGDVFSMVECSIDPRENRVTLHDKLMHLGAKLLIKELPLILSNQSTLSPQTGVESYASKLRASMGQIDWYQDAHQIDRHIRSLHGRFHVYTLLNEKRIIIHQASVYQKDDLAIDALSPGQMMTHQSDYLIVKCGTGALQIEVIQLSFGKGKVMLVNELLNGFSRFFYSGASFDS